MKIAVASEKGMVSEHFGHCEGFNVFEVNEKQILASELLLNPGHKHGFLPNLLKENEVDMVISGGMGGGALRLLNEKGIDVILGAKGSAETAVTSYLEGTLISTDSVCQGHHKGDHQHGHGHRHDHGHGHGQHGCGHHGHHHGKGQNHQCKCNE